MEHLMFMMMTWTATDGLTKWKTSVEKILQMLPAHLSIPMVITCATTSTVMMTMIHSLTQMKSCVTLIQKTNSLFQSMLIMTEYVTLYNPIETLTDGQMALKNPVALTLIMHQVCLLIQMATWFVIHKMMTEMVTELATISMISLMTVQLLRIQTVTVSLTQLLDYLKLAL